MRDFSWLRIDFVYKQKDSGLLLHMLYLRHVALTSFKGLEVPCQSLDWWCIKTRGNSNSVKLLPGLVMYGVTLLYNYFSKYHPLPYDFKFVKCGCPVKSIS